MLRHTTRSTIALSLSAVFLLHTATAHSEEPAPETPGIEVLARGPVHEGFAQPVDAQPETGPVVPKEPPAALEELPPEQKPEGDNVVWVSGYWSWDPDRSDYLWVSGFWRVVPPGRKWVPGYWTKGDSGWQWVSGFWASSQQSDMPYVPQEPPATLDRGPSVPAPGADYLYAPGTWLYRNDTFAWRPGFWYRGSPGYVYYPSRWMWTPGGYLFVNAYWDYPLVSRGVLFAPVWFPRPLWLTPGWSYSPYYTVSAPLLLSSLWVRAGYGYYAFGDYYAGRYLRLGYQPWLSYWPRYRDPLYGYYAWSNPGLRRNLVATFNGRVRGNLALPPRTLAAQRGVPAGQQVVQPLNRYRSDSLRLTRVTRRSGRPPRSTPPPCGSRARG